MAEIAGLDWPDYLRSLQDDDVRALAIWLAAEGLDVGELMEVVDRAYTGASEQWHGQSQQFFARSGRLAAYEYARRKRQFAALMATLEDALISGALPGDVAPQELRLLTPSWTKQRQPDELQAALERVKRGEE